MGLICSLLYSHLFSLIPLIRPYIFFNMCLSQSYYLYLAISITHWFTLLTSPSYYLFPFILYVMPKVLQQHLQLVEYLKISLFNSTFCGVFFFLGYTSFRQFLSQLFLLLDFISIFPNSQRGWKCMTFFFDTGASEMSELLIDILRLGWNWKFLTSYLNNNVVCRFTSSYNNKEIVVFKNLCFLFFDNILPFYDQQ